MRVPMVLRLHDGDDRSELFLCLLRIKFWVLIFICEPTWQIRFSKLQYNTCRRRMKVFSALCCWFYLTTCLSSLVMRLTTCGGWHVYSLLFMVFLLPTERFSTAATTPNWWPHINHSVLGFDHIFDHKQNRSTRRQECTRVWKSRFCVAEWARKSKNG